MHAVTSSVRHGTFPASWSSCPFPIARSHCGPEQLVCPSLHPLEHILVQRFLTPPLSSLGAPHSGMWDFRTQHGVPAVKNSYQLTHNERQNHRPLVTHTVWRGTNYPEGALLAPSLLLLLASAPSLAQRSQSTWRAAGRVQRQRVWP